MENTLIKHNPALKNPILTVLSLAQTITDRRALEEAALAEWKSSYSQNPATIINTLLRAEALQETCTVDGEPYEGTLEDMQLDESIADDAEVAVTLTVTNLGNELFVSYQPERTIQELIQDRPQYLAIFQAIIAACSKAEGATRSTLEQIVEQAPEAAASQEHAKVYPQYFLDALETAGAMIWDGAWRATTAGKATLGVFSN